MSLKIEDQHGPNQPAEGNHGLQKKLKISYTRDFLLSFSELDVCKRLPSGFDKSLLSEFEDTSQDRFRSSGSLSSQGFRHNEYGSSPPSRGDISNYSWASHGRWDSRFSRKSDWDSDSQSDRDSDSGRHCGNQPRRSWQVSEHDGLLGSGSFPRPTGHAVGSSVPKFRAANDHYHLNKSNEPYHPPRPYKAVPHFRRDTNDSYNDETFGSSECTSEDRAEEERKRREDSKDDKRLLHRDKESDELVGKPVSNDESDTSSVLPPAPVSRPLVPPGFSGAITGKNIVTKSLNHSRSLEEGSILHAKVESRLNGVSNNQEENQYSEQVDLIERQLGGPSVHVSGNEKSEKIPSFLSTLDVSSKTRGGGRFLEAIEVSGNSEVTEPDTGEVAGDKLLGEATPANSTSILEKLFGSALTLNVSGSSPLIEHNDAKAEESLSPPAVQSSKFAQWFLEEEKQLVDGLSSSRPDDLLSLIVGGEKSGSLGANTTEHKSANFPVQSSELAGKQVTSNLLSINIGSTEQYCSTVEPDVPAVITCEDLEQSIMLEMTENDSSFPTHVQGWSGPTAEAERQKANVDDLASQHLLSLLQRRTALNGMALSDNPGVRPPEKPQNTEVASLGAVLNSRELGAKNFLHSEKPLNLEALFGTAFMKELQPVGTTASSQKDSVGTARVDVSYSQGLTLPVRNEDHIASTVETPFIMPSFGSSALASNQRQQMKSDAFEKHLLGFDPQEQVSSSQLQTELGAKHVGFDKSVEVPLPEEDSLIAVSDPLSAHNFLSPRNSAKAEFLSIQETPLDIAEKLSALNSVIRDERPLVSAQERPPLLHGLYDERESDVQYHNLHVQTSSPQLHPQLNDVGPMFHPVDSYPANINAQMKFMSPRNMIHHDSLNNQFPKNMLRPPFHHPGTGMTGLDSAINNPALQQMHMNGNFPPHQLLHGFPGGAHLPPHTDNQVTGFIQGPGPMQSFPQRPPNFGGFGFPPQGGGTNHPEALRRLIEMELRSSSKQGRTFPAAGHSPGMYGHELGMGFGYR
uniref:Uncharacterized protein LOC105642935 isoform X2 n=1 Tax=Rhizophora mucronata TaxID=61149 RepID=A0A2P2LWL8_RHIMU